MMYIFEVSLGYQDHIVLVMLNFHVDMTITFERDWSYWPISVIASTHMFFVVSTSGELWLEEFSDLGSWVAWPLSGVFCVPGKHSLLLRGEGTMLNKKGRRVHTNKATGHWTQIQGRGIREKHRGIVTNISTSCLQYSRVHTDIFSWTSWMFSMPMALLRLELKGPDFFLVGLFPGMIRDW